MRLRVDDLEEGSELFLPDFAGALAGDVELADDLQRGRVRVGLFHADGSAEIETADDVREGTASIAVELSDGSVRVLDTDGVGGDEATGVTLAPVVLGTVHPDGWEIELPSDFAATDGGHHRAYRLVVWYDANDDGELSLSSDEGASEVARAPRPILETDGIEEAMTLFQLDPQASGEWIAMAGAGSLLALDYRDNWIDEDETDGWIATLPAAHE